MDKLLKGVIKFRQTVRSDLLQQFKTIKDNPKPTSLFFTCMDSRMLPTRITQSKPGDMFVARNAGNMIPDAMNYGFSTEVSVTTEPAALELAVKRGAIRHVIVCGHSDCKAMNLLYGLHQCSKNFDVSSPMDNWVRKNGFMSMKRLNERIHYGPVIQEFDSPIAPSQSFKAIIDPFERLPAEDKLSQINVLQQVINVASHEFLKEHFESQQLFVHAMWFDVYSGDIFLFSRLKKRFIVIDETTIDGLKEEIFQRCGDDGIMERFTEKRQCCDSL